jgi:hypothetical protein
MAGFTHCTPLFWPSSAESLNYYSVASFTSLLTIRGITSCKNRQYSAHDDMELRKIVEAE